MIRDFFWAHKYFWTQAPTLLRIGTGLMMVGIVLMSIAIIDTILEI